MSESSFAYGIHPAEKSASMSESSSAFRRAVASIGHRASTKPIFALLLAAVFAHYWFASTPLPLGGPNVIIGGVTVLLSIVYVLARAVRSGSISAVVPGILQRFRPILPITALCLAMLAWAAAVYLVFADAVDAVLLAQIALGIGILFAAFVCVDSVYRAAVVALSIVVAAFVSALFGAAVLFIGDPFLSIWVNISTIEDQYLRVVLADGRIAGLTPDTNALGYQLAAAVPIAFAALVYRPFTGNAVSRAAFDIALFVVLTTMTTVMFINFTRSVVVGVGAAAVVVALPALRSKQILRRLIVIVPAISIWLVVFFNVDAIGDASAAPGDSSNTAHSPAIPSPAPNPEDIPSDGLQRLSGTVTYPLSNGEFEVQVRTLSDQGVEEMSGVGRGSHDADRNFTLAWPQPHDQTSVIAYQGRVRPHSRRAGWREPWIPLTPLDGTSPHDIQDLSVVINGHSDPSMPDVIERFENLLNGANDAVVGHTFEHLIAWWHYTVQIRAWSGAEWLTSGVVSAVAGQDRAFVLSWEKPNDQNITDYQFRLLWNDEPEWGAWVPFVPGVRDPALPNPNAVDEDELKARMALYHFVEIGGSRDGLWEFTDKSTRARVPMALAALQYSLDNPLGTGFYSPSRSHLIRGLSPWMEYHVMSEPPHNQFLNVLVYYGFPGLTLLILFYVLLLRSLVRSGRFVLRSRDTTLSFLAVGAAGALLAHGVNGLARNAGGPFEGDWGYFLLVALAFAVHKIVDSRTAAAKSQQP